MYSRPDGSRLGPGDTLHLPDLVGTFGQIAEEGAAALYRGELARAIVQTVSEGGGGITERDLAGYRVVWRRPVRVAYLGHEVISNPPPSSGGILIAYGLALLERAGRGAAGSAESIALARRGDARADAGPRGGLHERSAPRRARAAPPVATRGSIAVWRGWRRERPGIAEPAPAGTTHVSAVDADGTAASLSSSTGSGSGVIVPGTGIHLNNMLGEYDLVAGGPAAPGRRLTSMMAPTVVVGGRRAAPRRRQRRLGAVARSDHAGDRERRRPRPRRRRRRSTSPRVHVDEPHVHCEGGFDPAVLDRVESFGYEVVRWRRRNLFFGGTNARRGAGRFARRRRRRPPRRCGNRHRLVSRAAVTTSWVERRDLAVAAGALAQELLGAQRLERRLEHLDEPGHAQPRRGHREDLLLRVDAEVDAGRQLPVERRRRRVGDVDVALRKRRQLAEHLERALDVDLVGRIVVVLDAARRCRS